MKSMTLVFLILIFSNSVYSQTNNGSINAISAADSSANTSVNAAYPRICDSNMEAALNELPEFLTSKRNLQSGDLPVECISAAMDTFYDWTLSVRDERRMQNQREIGHYTYCSSASETNPVRKHRPICPTNTYLNVVQNSYNDVLECMDISPMVIFPITAVESGFHINAVSLTNDDIGLGQITPIAIEDVNFDWDFVYESVLSSPKAACQRIAPVVMNIAKAEIPASYTCALTVLPENPIKNLLYLTFLHKKNEFYIDDYFAVFKALEMVEDLTKTQLSEEQRKSLKDILVTLSYNVGNQAATQYFSEFLMEQFKPIQNMTNILNDYKSTQIELYLDYKTLLNQGEIDAANELLATRENNQRQIAVLRNQLETFKVNMDVFNINSNPYDFGAFLASQKNVHYLNVLKDRIKYVEETLLKKPGFCSVPDYLKSIE